MVDTSSLPDSPLWFELLADGAVLTGFDHGEYPSIGPATHPGVDIGLQGDADCGLPLQAPLRGEVIRVVSDTVSEEELDSIGLDEARNRRDLERNTGYAVILRHEISNETIFSIYLHLAEPPADKEGELWRVGMEMDAGDQIGLIGDTGFGSGCHLHFEARRFEGTYKYLHPRFGNIYPAGDVSQSDVFLNDWLRPEDFLRRAFIFEHMQRDLLETPSTLNVPSIRLPGTQANSTDPQAETPSSTSTGTSPAITTDAEPDRDTIEREVVRYYDTRGEWAGVYQISVLRMRLSNLSQGRLRVDVEYRFSCILSVRARCSGGLEGIDRRFFMLNSRDGVWVADQMGGYLSGRL
ncbi:MAG: M23 family metallopeptidase [Pseudomonadota bacterium]